MKIRNSIKKIQAFSLWGNDMNDAKHGSLQSEPSYVEFSTVLERKYNNSC